MSFLNGYFLWLLLPIMVYLYREKKSRTLQQGLRWLTLLLLLIAMARPIISNAPTEEILPAHSLIIALDLSASMAGDDIVPSRAEASRESIKEFLKMNKYDKIALIGFTINPLLLSPSTSDHHLVSLALESMHSNYIMTKGTSIKRLLEKVAQFPDVEKKLILFTDGGDEILDEELQEFVKKFNVKILTIAMATENGSTISDKDGKVLKDKKGHLVISTFNRSLALLGEVIRYEGVDTTVKKIENWVEEQKLLEEGLKKELSNAFELFFIPLLLALFSLFLSATRFSLKLLTLLALLNINVQAEVLLKKELWGEEVKIEKKKGLFFDTYYLAKAYEAYRQKKYKQSIEELSKIEENSLESALVLAHSYYQLEAYKRAENILLGIKTTLPKLKQQLLYELGNCEAKMLYYDKAKSYYVQALALGEDADTLHNLAWVIFQKKINKSKIGFTQPHAPQASKNASNSEESEENSPLNKKEKGSESGGGEGKKSKNSSVKIVKSQDKSSSKRVMSSKAYELINEGYIKESKPW